MFIQTEATPNPATLKFIPGRAVLDSGTMEFANREAAARSPLAEKLFGVPGVTSVFYGSDFVTVTKDDSDWQHLKPAILGAIMEHYMSGAPLLADGTAGNDEALDEDEQEEILEKLPPSERDALGRSLDYPENSAGRRMQTEFIAVPQGWSAGQAIDHIHDSPDLPDRFYEIYAVDGGQHWQGAVSLDALLRARRTVPLTDLVDEDRRRVCVNDDQEEVARLFGKYNLVAAPVVDTENRLVGVITVDDVVDVIEEEADEDLKALGGVTRHEELSDNVWTIAKGRFNWLLVNLATAFLASSVLGLFEGQLEKMVALAVLAPIVASQGGNAATQTMTVAVRALATRELGSNNALRVVLREGLVGLVNGLAFAVITGIAAVLWFKIPGLGVVIGLAIVCNLVAGALGGILIPMVLERVRADPAVASGTFVTTITDVVGFFSFLGIATLWFGLG
ncbi:MAG: hypothetical protein NVSMB20_12920 [Bradyrhizobium sp.]